MKLYLDPAAERDHMRVRGGCMFIEPPLEHEQQRFVRELYRYMRRPYPFPNMDRRTARDIARRCTVLFGFAVEWKRTSCVHCQVAHRAEHEVCA